MKQAFKSTAEAVSYPTSVTLSISGLREVSEGVFELSDITQRFIDHAALRAALGGADDDLMDKISSLVFKHDMVSVLVERMR